MKRKGRHLKLKKQFSALNNCSANLVRLVSCAVFGTEVMFVFDRLLSFAASCFLVVN